MEDVSLIYLRPHELGTIKEITGGRTAKKRLYELGLNRGTKVRMVKNDLGPIILNVSGFKLALGRGLADKVFIER